MYDAGTRYFRITRVSIPPPDRDTLSTYISEIPSTHVFGDIEVTKAIWSMLRG